MSDLGAGIALAALFLSIAYCSVQQDERRSDEVKTCLDHGGYQDTWTGSCKIKGRNA